MEETKGIIVGCDQAQEVFLPWWWSHYSRHNSYPVLFVNFGMSDSAVRWCKQRGECLTVSCSITLQEVAPCDKTLWEMRYGNEFWPLREIWFKKPSALLLSPFSLGIWIDLDCKINGPLEEIFTTLASFEIGLARELESPFTPPGEVSYNAGVIAFQRNAPILHQWAHLVSSQNASFAGDQNALCHAIAKHKPPLKELPIHCNWGRLRGPNEDVLIYHHTGTSKLFIIEEMFQLGFDLT